MDMLANEQNIRGRDFATWALRQWIAWRNDHELLLYRQLQEKMNYRALEAEVVLELLHTFPPEARGNPETYEKLIANLTENRMAIRHLSYWHLVALVPEGRTVKYDPAGDKKARELGQVEWRKLIPEGKLPPPPKTKPK
jgi:hypothetical protein